MTRLAKFLFAILISLVLALGYQIGRPISAPLSDKVRLEELTWVEVRDLVAQGKTIAIVPTGGTEQNGPHVVLGKHNYIVRFTAGKIAEELGNALVAPVISYVPEGRIEPPEGHMAFPGTISISEDLFEAVLESAARSLRAHGFKVICFVGDSGGNQKAQAAIAERLNGIWAGSGVQVIDVSDYYDPWRNGQLQWLADQGESAAAIGSHAGIRDTSELMAVYPEGVRDELRAPNGGHRFRNTGVNGDPTRATSDRGKKLLGLKIDAAVRQIRDQMGDMAS